MDVEMLKVVEGDQYKSRPDVRVGDTVKLHLRISEGGKERIQIFEGIVLAIKGSGNGKTVTVRRIASGVGVEKIVPYNSPLLEKIEVVKRGNRVRRSKLYYMRDRIGRKAMKIRGGVSDVYLTDEETVVEEEIVEVEEVVVEVAEVKEEVKAEK
jgi:large subunit ribosomal protein L19